MWGSDGVLTTLGAGRCGGATGYLPHWVLVGVGELGARDGCTVVGSHDALGQKEVTEETRDKEILAKQLLEEF